MHRRPRLGNGPVWSAPTRQTCFYVDAFATTSAFKPGAEIGLEVPRVSKLQYNIYVIESVCVSVLLFLSFLDFFQSSSINEVPHSQHKNGARASRSTS